MIFEDRTDAAYKLAKKMEWLKKEDPIILAIPRGGVVTGDVIAAELGVKLDVVVSKKIVAPYNPELAIGAVMHDGSYFPNEDITRMLNVPQNYIDSEIKRLMKEIDRRLMKFRGSKEYHLEGRTVVLVDDGIATGATMLVAIYWVKKQKPKKLIIAVPVGPKDTIDRLNKVADDVIVLYVPVDFGAIGEFYRDFGQVEDFQVQEIMSKYGYKMKLSE
ncbi:MAG: phosphoribosyltransferase [Thaumarchaeota archaeon]|nr:phosphoribosyltransferase [Nitrososphaerota archaeon]